MDELLKALAEAVREGRQLAMPALIGYYIVRIVESLTAPAAVISVFFIIGRTVLRVVKIVDDSAVAHLDKKIALEDARRHTYVAGIDLHAAQVNRTDSRGAQ